MQTITKKRMLYKSKVEYMSGPGVYTMNHVLGCSHGCKYPCYAYLIAKRFGQIDSYEDWCNPKLIENTISLLETELKTRRKEPISRVHLCFTTDPFPCGPLNERGYPDWTDAEQNLFHDIVTTTMKSIELINSYGIPDTVLTKGLLPHFDIDEGPNGEKATLLRHGLGGYAGSPHPDNEYGISLVSLNENFRKEYEPNAVSYAERIANLKSLHDASCKTWVSMEPFPALTYAGHIERYSYEDSDYPDNVVSQGRSDFTSWLSRRADSNEHVMLVDCLNAIKFTDKIVFGRWNYNNNMPCDVNSPDQWYERAEQIVRDFCIENNIEYIIKKSPKKPNNT